MLSSLLVSVMLVLTSFSSITSSLALLPGGDLQLEAIDIAGALGRLVLADQVEVGAVGMLDQHDAIVLGAVLDVVGLLLAAPRVVW